MCSEAQRAGFAGIKAPRKHLVSLLPSLARHQPGLNHDLCDALVAAYTAFLAHIDRAELVGDPEEGLITVPSAQN